jgi:hypothetical protein
LSDPHGVPQPSVCEILRLAGATRSLVDGKTFYPVRSRRAIDTCATGSTSSAT